jgi:hypothetical protein
VAGLLAIAAVLASESPAEPFLVGVIVVALLTGVDVFHGLIGDRSRALALAARPASALRAIDRRVEPWIVSPFRVAARLVEQGGELAIAAPTEALVRACARAGEAALRFQRSSVWAQEALLLAAAGAIVAYWIVR